MARFHSVLFYWMTLTCVTGERRCYQCNSATDTRCESTEKVRKAQDLARRCEVFDDFHTLMHGRESPTDHNNSNDFTFKPVWAATNGSDYTVVCKKIVMKLHSRDPPGTKIDPKLAITDTRNAMPRRILRYCGIEKINDRHQTTCSSTIASGKMEVTVCWCKQDLCNTAPNSKTLFQTATAAGMTVLASFYFI